jgi:hypothetical protein
MWRIVNIVVVVVPFLLGLSHSFNLFASDKTDVRPPDSGPEFLPNIFVEQQTDCMAVSDIKSSLVSVIKNREEFQYIIISVVVSPAVAGTLATLRVIARETGEILMERTLSILPEECVDAHLVLKVMLEQFLATFPIEEWKESQAPSPSEIVVRTETVVVEKDRSFLNWLLLVGIDSRWPTPSGDIEIALGLDAGAKRHGLVGRLIARVGWPNPLGEGRQLETAALTALGWRFSPNEKLGLTIEIRTGALRVSGVGYEKNYHQWLVMVEAEFSVLWKIGPITLGPAVAVSPPIYTVYTDSGERADLPWIRLGMLLGIPLGKTELK